MEDVPKLTLKQAWAIRGLYFNHTHLSILNPLRAWYLQGEERSTVNRDIHIPLIQEILSWIPSPTASIIFSMIHRWCNHYLWEFDLTEQQVLLKVLISKKDIVAPLIIEYANYLTRPYLHSMDAQESLNFIKNEQLTKLMEKKTTSPESRSTTDTSWGKAFNL